MAPGGERAHRPTFGEDCHPRREDFAISQRSLNRTMKYVIRTAIGRPDVLLEFALNKGKFFNRNPTFFKFHQYKTKISKLSSIKSRNFKFSSMATRNFQFVFNRNLHISNFIFQKYAFAVLPETRPLCRGFGVLPPRRGVWSLVSKILAPPLYLIEGNNYRWS